MDSFILPKRFEEYTEGRKAGFMKMKAAKEAGKKVAGYFCAFTPLEVLDAAGLLSVGLCGMSEETIPEAEEVLPKNLCPLIKSSYGFAITEKCPYTYWSDLIIGETTCDGKKKMYELLSQIKKMYVLQIPQGVSLDYARTLWLKEIKAFVRYIENTFAVTITNDMLRSAAKKRNELRAASAGLMELQRQDPAPVSGLQLYKFLDSLKFNFDIDDAIAATRRITAELQQEYDKNRSSLSGGEKRLLITGCPIGGVLEKVTGAVEKNGGRVVCYENCSGIKPVRCQVDTGVEDMIEAIADAYLKIGCSVMSPNVHRKETLPELIKEFRADGVLDVTLQACHTYMIETRAMRQLCNELNVPYMPVETDYSRTDDGQINTRIAAFLEML